jgi:MFS family permease
VRRTVALLALCGVVSHSLARSTYPILLPAIEEELLDNHQQSGLLTTANFAAYMAGVGIVTSVGGRFEPARILRVGLACAVVGFGVLATATGFWTVAIGQALAGVASAAIWMTAPALATSSVGPNRRGTMMGLMSSTMGVGIVLASQGTRLARELTEDDGLWRPTWLAAAAFSLALLIAIALALRTPATASISGGVSLSRLRSVPGWLPLTGAHLCSGLVVSSFAPFFGAALEEQGFDRAHVANLYSLLGLAAVFAAITLGRLSDRTGRRPVLIGALLTMSVTAMLVILGREPFATIAAAGFGAASFTFPVLVTAYLSDHVKDRAFSNALGALTLIYGFSLILGPTLSGTIGDSRLGFDAVFIGLAVIALVGALAARSLPIDREAVVVAPTATT